MFIFEMPRHCLSTLTDFVAMAAAVANRTVLTYVNMLVNIGGPGP